MSVIAQDLIELRRLVQDGAGTLTRHLLREIAMNIIASGVADWDEAVAVASTG